MVMNKLRMFGTLLYKNFLVRKRHWKLGLFVEILLTLLIFVSVWAMKTYTFNHKVIGSQLNEVSNGAMTDLVQESKSAYSYFSDYNDKTQNQLLVVPDNEFTKSLVARLQDCYPGTISMYPDEDALMDDYMLSRNSKINRYSYSSLGLVFNDINVNSSTKNFDYKIKTRYNLPSSAYATLGRDIDAFDTAFAGLQLCVDQALITMKHNDTKFNLVIKTREMPQKVEKGGNDLKENFGQIVCAFVVAAFLIPLCIETSHASSEKFLGVNVLMSMNGVPNILNLLSWLVTGLIFSLFYIIPIILILTLAANEDSRQFIEYGNVIIVYLVLTLNIGHLITFGIHVSAYFTRSLFMVTGLILAYVGSIVFMRYGIQPDSYEFIPYLGIIFPNMLLFRGWEEINFYEDIQKGVGFKNMFQVSNRAYGIEGSVGFVLIFSVIGMFLHLILANYIYAINPGKYGVKKGPFYFLKIFKRKSNTGDYDKVENFEFNDTQGNTFEPATERVYTPGIQIRNLKKMYKTSLFSKAKVYALRGVSVDFYQGHITALLGHNGAGKTTMMSILSGMIGATEGLVLVNGKNVKDDISDIMNDMGLCPQENMLFPQLSVAEQVKFFAMLKSKDKSMSVINSQVTQLLNKLQLLGKRNSLPSELSGGQKRRACLAMALIGDSKTLVLDEPTSGLDPESKRDIWNILLKMRGQKTILISTHDMEEADVLGDRIAIMHTGQLKSYGTPMYLKKLLGRGNIEVTLSTEPWCDPENVRSHLDTQSEVISDDHGKMVLSIPYNDQLPETLDKIEEHKKELGITGMSVSVITMEKVFLKVTQDNDDPSDSRRPFTNVTEKLEGINLLLHTLKGLIYKKGVYTLKNISSTIAIFLLLLAALLSGILILKEPTVSVEPIPITFDMYHNTEIYYKTHRYSKPYSLNYAHVVRDLGGVSYGKSGNTTIDQDLLQIANKSVSNYNYHVLMAADFEVANEDHNKVVATALFNPKIARFAEPISINLVSNAILRNVTDDNHTIGITAQQFPEIRDAKKNQDSMRLDAMITAYTIALVFAFFIYPAVALFVIHPIREAMTNVKHLQRMTGASCFSYWGSMFAFDLVAFFVMILVFVIGFVIADCIVDLRIFGCKEVFIQLGLFTLFIVNILPLVYIFSFWKKSTAAAIKLLSLMPLALVLVDVVMSLITILAQFTDDSEFLMYRRIQKGIFLFTPYVSFFEGQLAFFNSSSINSDCRKLADHTDFNTTCRIPNYGLSICCDMNCTEDTCGQAVPYFRGWQPDISLNMSFLALCLTPFLYFGILLILEYQVFERLFAMIRGGMPDNIDDRFEEQVKKVKHEIAYEVCKAKIDNMSSNGSPTAKFQTIPETSTEQILQNEQESKNYVFFVYELRKLYGLFKKFVAVQDISFGVNESECFGLLGVNGAGKTTSFKMMTGEIIPNHGVIHLRDNKLSRNKSYLNQIGYCPQNDAIIRSLNSYDHLRLFARLRGIPEDKVEQEVKNWIDRLNLNVCALQPSGTYSGGNKRRLNIAMALIGIPNLVLLDEPTTGVDPAARRSLWNTIQSCQATGQAVVLTSHSMEECEALCNKLAIMVDGKFVCIGPSEELKQRFGAGFDIYLKLSAVKPEGEVEKIKQELSSALPGEVVDETSGSILYHVSSTKVTWRKMYDVMNELKDKYNGIEDFSVLSSTLEQLFLLFAKAADRKKT